MQNHFDYLNNEERYISLDEWRNNLNFSTNFYSKNTIDSYICDVKDFIKYMKNYKKASYISSEIYAQINTTDMANWLYERQQKRNFCHRSNARAVYGVKNFYNFLKKKFNIENKNIESFKPPKVRKNLPRPIDIAKIEEIILTESDSCQWIAKRDICIIKLMYCSGLRISEALSITKKQIERKSNTLKIIGKGNKERIVPILESLKKEIKDFINLCPHKMDSNKKIFLSKKGLEMTRAIFQKSISKIRNKTGINFTSHNLRHSFATHMLENGANIKIIGDILGHSSLTTTQIYTNVSTNKKIEEYDKIDLYNSSI